MNQVFVGSLPPPGQAAVIEGDEHHYLTRSVRARKGERVRLADGVGQAAEAVLEEIGAASALARLEKTLPLEPPESDELFLCAPKGEALDSALEQAVQLGVGSLTLLRSERTLANFDGAALRPARLERLLREACRQCQRSRVPRLAPPLSLREALPLPPGRAGLLASERGGLPLAKALALAGAGGQRLLVGPEGGFSAAEVDAALAAGWIALTLGPHALRVPTAVAALLGGIQALRSGAA